MKKLIVGLTGIIVVYLLMLLWNYLDTWDATRATWTTIQTTNYHFLHIFVILGFALNYTLVSWYFIKDLK